jgi:hypothetical protein
MGFLGSCEERKRGGPKGEPAMTLRTGLMLVHLVQIVAILLLFGLMFWREIVHVMGTSALALLVPTMTYFGYRWDNHERSRSGTVMTGRPMTGQPP